MTCNFSRLHRPNYEKTYGGIVVDIMLFVSGTDS